MKKVLITGANSYIGTSFERYAQENYPSDLRVDTVDMLDGKWRQGRFDEYDVVFHVAGIAHADVNRVDETTKAKYYAVNTDLAIEVAKKAQAEGVGQFVFMSSAIIYGDSASYGYRKRITRDTAPSPSNFYGDSKWQADQGVRALSSEDFIVTVLRPPMIYGPGSKGNYSLLARLAKRLPIFPDVDNERSMLYVGNLCEFLCQIIMRGEGGVFWPQNAEYTKTAEMVRLIGKAHGHTVRLTKALNWTVGLASRVPGKVTGLVNKAFGSLSYDQSMSTYDFGYQSTALDESIALTEARPMRALQLASVASMIDQFNMPNIQLLKSLGYDVDVVADFTHPGTITEERARDLRIRLESDGVRVYDVGIPRTLSIKAIFSAYHEVKCLMGAERYRLIHCHSPIGGAICRLAARAQRSDGAKVIYTAHGFHFYSGAPLKNWLVYYPIEWMLSWCTDVLITINREDFKRARDHFHAKKTVYVPGVGVDTKKFRPRESGRKRIRTELGLSANDTLLLSVGELNENKNHSSVIRAIKGMDVSYVVVGEGEKYSELEELAIEYDVDLRLTGYRQDVADFYDAADAYVLSSIREGLNVSLMEAMASGLSCAASRIRGNVDLINEDDGTLFNPNDVCEMQTAIANALDRKAELGAKNLEKIRFFDLTQIEDFIYEVYAGACANK